MMKLYIARNQDGSLALFRKKKPKLFWDEKVGQYWVGSSMWLHPNEQPEGSGTCNKEVRWILEDK